MRRRSFFIVGGAAIAVVAACDSGPVRSKSVFPTDPGASDSDRNTDKKQGDVGVFSTGGGALPADPAEACASAAKKVTRPGVDIIVVIDTSGSMNEETEQVRQNINAFGESIGGAGLDYNVIMIAQKAMDFGPGFPATGICVPPPLGGANCSDNAPKYHHLDTPIASTNSLRILVDEFAEYEPWLRPDAYKVFIEVTDDNSAPMQSAAFDEAILAKSPAQFGDVTKRRYIFNSICGYARNTPVLSADKCASAVNTGEVYQQLSTLTGGTIDSVCETSYASVFDNIAKGLVTKLGCEFAYPTSEGGKATDPDSVLVTYAPGDGSPSRSLARVATGTACEGNTEGWYYDDPARPTKIMFCPTTCNGPGADTAGEVSVKVGCAVDGPR